MKPTLTAGASSITLDYPSHGSLRRRNVSSRVRNTTMSGTELEQYKYWKFQYELRYDLSTRYMEVFNFIKNATDDIYFSYSDRWGSADNVKVVAEISDDTTGPGSLSSFTLTLNESGGR